MYLSIYIHIACQVAGSGQYSEITDLGRKGIKKKGEREKFDSELEGLMVKRMFFWEQSKCCIYIWLGIICNEEFQMQIFEKRNMERDTVGTAVFPEKKMDFWTIFYWNLNETIITAGKKGKNVALEALLFLYIRALDLKKQKKTSIFFKTIYFPKWCMGGRKMTELSKSCPFMCLVCVFFL